MPTFDIRHSWGQFVLSSVLVVVVFALQTWQWHRSLDEAREQWSASLDTSTKQWVESLETSSEQWLQDGPVIRAVEDASRRLGHTNMKLDFSEGTWTQVREPYVYAYVVSNTGRADAAILSASLLGPAGETILPHMCADDGFPAVLPAGSSMVLGARSIGGVFEGGTIQVLLSSGVSQKAEILPLDDFASDREVFETFYGDVLDRVAQSCEPVDFMSLFPDLPSSGSS